MHECFLHSRCGPQGEGGLCAPMQDMLEGRGEPRSWGDRQMLRGTGRHHRWPTGGIVHPCQEHRGRESLSNEGWGWALKNPQKYPGESKGLLNPRQAQQAQCQLLVTLAPSTTPVSNSGGFGNLGNGMVGKILRLVKEESSPYSPFFRAGGRPAAGLSR